MQSKLIDLIRAQIRQQGPQPFSWFMRQALYHPEYGYYSSGRAVIGRRGDYFTNVSVGPLFGRLIATQFVEMWHRLGKPTDFVVVEQGAHDARFARDLLQGLREQAPELFAVVRYRIVEPFAALRQRQRKTLEKNATGQAPSSLHEKIEWSNELTPFSGVHFSNELLDAFPVDLRDRRVGLSNDDLVFVPGPVTSQPNESQLAWVSDIAANLQRGFVLAVDYGFAQPDFHEAVQARAHHRLLDSPFESIGEADISVHLNWTDIAEHALQRGFEIAGFTDQHHFLTGLISAMELTRDSNLTALSSHPPEDLPSHQGKQPQNLTALSSQVSGTVLSNRERRALQTLLHPEMLGRAFQVLCLTKAVDALEPLAGFRFARDPRRTLGLAD